MSPTVSPALHALSRWVAHQPTGLELEFVCAEHVGSSLGDPARTVVRLPTCIRDVPAYALLELLTAGAATVLVSPDGCEQPDTATEHLRVAASVLEAAGAPRLSLPGAGDHSLDSPDAVEARPVLDAERMPVARRNVFGLGGAPVVDLIDQNRPAPERLNVALASLVPPESRDGLDAPQSAVRLRAPGCTACGVCVRACPTDALSLKYFGETGTAASAANGNGIGDDAQPRTGPLVTSLLQNPVACDGCQLCVQLCPADVLTVAGTWAWDEVLARVDAPTLAPVASLTTKECTRCSARFPTTDASSLCSVCAYRRANPFSSVLPPGVVLPPSAVAQP